MIHRVLLLLLLMSSPAWSQVADRFLILDLSTSKPGVYAFIVTMSAEGNISYKRSANIVIVNGTVPIPIPPTDPPTDPPLTGLAAKVADWATLVSYANVKQDAAKLAMAYDEVAGRIENKTLKTPAIIVATTTATNVAAMGEENYIRWRSFSDKLGEYLNAELLAGRIVTAEQHAPIWRQVAMGLRSAAR